MTKHVSSGEETDLVLNVGGAEFHFRSPAPELTVKHRFDGAAELVIGCRAGGGSGKGSAVVDLASVGAWGGNGKAAPIVDPKDKK